MTIKIGDILFAKWLVPSQDSVLGPIIRGRHVIVTATDEESITVMPVEPHQTSSIPYDGNGNPTARTAEGTVVVFLPCSADGMTVPSLHEVGA